MIAYFYYIFSYFAENFNDMNLVRGLIHLLPGVTSKVGGKTRKPSTVEAQNALIKIVDSETDITAVMDEQVNSASADNKTLQPRIICVVSGETVCSSNVIINDVMYKLPTVIKALDITFKSHMTLNACYSKETHNFYTFLQKYVYQISTKYDKLNSCVANLQEILSRNA